MKIWISWLDSSHGLLVALLSAGGVVFVRFRSQWPRAVRAEFYLAAWIAAVLLVHISQAHPTFSQYYMLAIPFFAILSSAAIYAIGSRWAVAAVAVILAAGLAKSIAEGYYYTWPELEQLAHAVDTRIPPGAAFVADEQVYYLARRLPPSGMELNDSHKLHFDAAQMAALHLLSEAEIERRIRSGAYALVESCSEYESFEDAAAARYKRQAKVVECLVYW
jgi:hypothetical protein